MRWTLVGLLLLGCPSVKDDSEVADTGVSTLPPLSCTDTLELVAGDAQNYAYTVDIDIVPTSIQALSDATVCWSDVTTDIRGRPLDPSTIEQVTLTRVSLTEAETEQAVIQNTLTQEYVADIRMLVSPTDTCAQLTDFSIIGNFFLPEFDMPEDPDTTWLASVWKFNDYGRNEILMSGIFEPLAASDNNTFDINDSSTALTFDADLQSLSEVRACEGPSQLWFDWSGVTVDATGKAWDSRTSDTLLIGKVAGSVADAEESFIQLYETAEAIWTMPVYGLTRTHLLDDGTISAVDYDGRTLVPRALDGTAFPGFDSTGTWLIGIECSTCTSPAPTFLTVVSVE